MLHMRVEKSIQIENGWDVVINTDYYAGFTFESRDSSDIVPSIASQTISFAEAVLHFFSSKLFNWITQI
jgi:hypothetical protein